MWIFTKKGFYSVVRDRGNPEFLCVRARVAGDIEALLPRSRVQENRITDYRFRARVPSPWLKEAMEEEIDWIDYGNFKDSVRDPRRLRTYGAVWTEMADMQEYIGLAEDMAQT